MLAALGHRALAGGRLAAPVAGLVHHATTTSPPRRSACPDAARRLQAHAPRRSAGMTRARARGDVGRGRLVGGRRPPRGGRPRGGRRHPQALGRRVRLGLLLGGRRRRRPSRGSAARHRAPRLQLRRRLRRARRRALRRRPRRRAHAEPVHRVQPPPQVRPAAAAGRRPRLRRRRHRPPRPHRGAAGRHPAGRPGRRRRPRTSRTSSTCSTRRRLARVRFPVGAPHKADVRAEAARLGLATADKPDSQDVCFITATGGRRRTFLGDRIADHARPGRRRGGRRGRRGRRRRAGHDRPAPRPRAARRHATLATSSTSTSPTPP